MGLFFERRQSGDPIADAIQGALAESPAAHPDLAMEASRRSAQARATKAAAPIQVKSGRIAVALLIVAALLAAAFVLAAAVDPQLIAQAEKAASTPGYAPPDLQLMKLSETVQALLIAWSGGLAGALLGDGLATATTE